MTIVVYLEPRADTIPFFVEDYYKMKVVDTCRNV